MGLGGGGGSADFIFMGQELKPEPEPSFPVKLHWNTEETFFVEEPPEPLEPFHPRTVTEPNRTGSSPLKTLTSLNYGV